MLHRWFSTGTAARTYWSRETLDAITSGRQHLFMHTPTKTTRGALRLRQLARSHSGKSVLVASRVESTVVTTPVFCVATTVTGTTNLRRSPDELPPSTNGTRRVQRRTQPRTTDDLPLLPQPPTITLGRTACVHHGATSNAAMSTYIVHGGRHYDYGSWRVAARVNRCS